MPNYIVPGVTINLPHTPHHYSFNLSSPTPTTKWTKSYHDASGIIPIQLSKTLPAFDSQICFFPKSPVPTPANIWQKNPSHFSHNCSYYPITMSKKCPPCHSWQEPSEICSQRLQNSKLLNNTSFWQPVKFPPSACHWNNLLDLYKFSEMSLRPTLLPTSRSQHAE